MLFLLSRNYSCILLKSSSSSWILCSSQLHVKHQQSSTKSFPPKNHNYQLGQEDLPITIYATVFAFCFHSIFGLKQLSPVCSFYFFHLHVLFFFLASTTCLLSYLGNISFRVLNCLLSKHLWATSLPNISTAGPQVNKEHPHLTTYNWIYLFFFCLTPGLSHNLSRRDEEFCLT